MQEGNLLHLDPGRIGLPQRRTQLGAGMIQASQNVQQGAVIELMIVGPHQPVDIQYYADDAVEHLLRQTAQRTSAQAQEAHNGLTALQLRIVIGIETGNRSEEHTSELQSR